MDILLPMDKSSASSSTDIKISTEYSLVTTDADHKVRIIIQAIEHISLYGNIHNRCIKDDVLLKLLQLPPDINIKVFNQTVARIFPSCIDQNDTSCLLAKRFKRHSPNKQPVTGYYIKKNKSDTFKFDNYWWILELIVK